MKGYSAEAEPLVPALKLSTNLTVWFSSGTVVPPDFFLYFISLLFFLIHDVIISI